MNKFKQYDRKLIQLNNDTAMLIHLFFKDPERVFEDIEICNTYLYDVCNTNLNVYKEAAQQLFDQLEGHWCRAFCEALRDKCNELIENDKKMCEEFFKQKIND